MSPLDSILGLKGLAIQRVERRRDIHVWAKPKDRPACVHCSHAVVRIKATHQRTLKHTRQGNQLMVLHLSVPKYHCTQCNRYFRHRFTGIRPRLRATEAYRLEVFEAHDGGVSQRKLTLTHRIGSATVERWYQSYVKQRVSELSGRACPQVLGIDEHFFSRKKGYATTLVDLKNHKVFDVVLANILAGPLINLAPLLTNALSTDGDVVLSGILSAQSLEVMAAYQPYVAYIDQTIDDGWVRLHARKRNKCSDH